MTGSGTQSDPYIIQSWSEFKSAFTSDSKYWYKIKDNSVWDMNELEPSGDSPSISINNYYSKYINGNGVVIKNLRLKSNPFFRLTHNSPDPIYISNFIIENIYGQNNLVYLDQSSDAVNGTITFNDCIITGFFTQPVFKYWKGDYYNIRRVYLNRCGVDIDIMGNTAFQYRMPFIFTDSYCKLKYYNNILPKVLGDHNGNYISTTMPKFNNTFVDIDIMNRTSGGVISFYISSDSTNSIYNIKTPTTSDSLLEIHDASGLVLLNSSFYKANCPTKATGGVYDWSAFPSIKRLTDDQMKSPSYIRSIGFPIGGD